MIKAILTWILLLIPFGISAQLKSFEFSNPLAIPLTDSAIQLLTSQTWVVNHIDTDNRGILTETQVKKELKYHTDGSFTYRFSGKWEIAEDRYIKHLFENDEGKEVNFGGIYAVVELSPSTLTLSKILTSSHDMKRTMYFQAKSDDLPVVSSSFRMKPIFTASSNLYKGKTDPVSLDSISRLSTEHLFTNDYLFENGIIYLAAPDSLYRIKRKVQ